MYKLLKYGGNTTMIIGFTGTRDGITKIQEERVVTIMHNLLPHRYDLLIHGGAEGADDAIHSAAGDLFDFRIEIYPCKESRRTYWIQRKQGRGEDYFVHTTREPLERNRIIADRCNHLIATPFQMVEIVRSGTWATIRYAREKRKSVTIVFPDGSVSEERRNGDRNLLNLHRVAK
jgi:hypothetical protein